MYYFFKDLIYCQPLLTQICKSLSINKPTGLRTALKGLPQGSILRPILYIIYTCDLEDLLPAKMKIIEYADDVRRLQHKSYSRCSHRSSLSGYSMD